MKAIAIQNFRYGQDVRRLEETTQPGVLVSLTNAHINQGGEIEKRKTFEKITLPVGTFGGQVTATGIAVFGSADMSGETFPAPFYYVRCMTDPNTPATMIGVIASTCFGGSTVAVCDFDTDGVYTFLDGDVIDDLSSGKLAIYLADSNALADYMASVITAGGIYTASANSGTVTITGPTGQSFSVDSNNESTCTAPLDTTPPDATASTLVSIDTTFIASDCSPDTWDVGVYYVEGVSEWALATQSAVEGTSSFSITAAEFEATVGKKTGLTGSLEFRYDGSGGGSDATNHPSSQLTVSAVVTFDDAATRTLDYTLSAVPGGLVDTHETTIATTDAPESLPTITTSVISDGTQPVSGVIPQTQFSVIAVNPTGTGIVTDITIGGTKILNTGTAGLARSGTNYDTPALLATALKNQINTYCTANNIDFSATVTNNIVVIRATDPTGYTALTGATVEVTVDDDVCIGNGAVRFSRASVTDPSWTSFSIDGADQLGGTVNWSTDMTTSVVAVSAQFNSNSTTYTSVPVGSTLFVSKLVTSSNDVALQLFPIGTNLNWEDASVGGGNTGVNGGTAPWSISVLPSLSIPVRILAYASAGRSRTVLLETAEVQVAVGSSSGPFFYQWEQVDPGLLEAYSSSRTETAEFSAMPFVTGTTSPIMQFRGYVPIFIAFLSGTYLRKLSFTLRCKVVDSLSRTSYSPLITFHYP